jgi:hypothetical protein
MPTYEATARSNEFTAKDVEALRTDLDGVSVAISLADIFDAAKPLGSHLDRF